LIEVRNIDKSFGEAHVLQDISSVFEKGKTNLIIGASGSGKTTLCKCIVGLHEPDAGDVLFDGRNFVGMNNKDKKEIRREIGFLFQGSALFDSMTVEQNIRFPLSMFSKMTVAESQKRVDYCLERVNMPGVNNLLPSELSGGMKKRVGIARAIAMSPQYLFCDEPNSGLDPQTSILIDNLIHEITIESNITTIVITHDMNSVMEIGENIIFLHKGKLWWSGNKEEILDTENPEVVDFVYASSYMRAFKQK
jgi:phospholipid/cholesterol/gamma-HCH transport system ATP-binding protein